jgi:hypothetical protein
VRKMEARVRQQSLLLGFTWRSASSVVLANLPSLQAQAVEVGLHPPTSTWHAPHILHPSAVWLHPSWITTAGTKRLATKGW